VHGKYPKHIEVGKTRENSYKWNHQQFSSKIKSIQVSYHPEGHLNEITFQYEKG
jgi:hypothetical protein